MLKQKMENAIKSIKKIKETPFDKFDVTLDRGAIGGLLRDRLAELTNMQSSVRRRGKSRLKLWLSRWLKGQVP